MATRNFELAVFAWLPDKPESKFVPAGLLNLSETVGAKGMLATLDNALTYFSAFVSARPLAVEIIRRVWGEVREWKTTFEAYGAERKLLGQVEGAFRQLEHIASPALVDEIRNGT